MPTAKFSVSLKSVVDSNNSTTTPLGSSSTYTGDATDVSSFSTIAITIFADQDSATNGMQFQFSTDGTNWDDVYNFNLDASSSQTRRFQFPVTAQYFRINYINGTSAQSVFRVQTILHPTNILPSVGRVEDVVTDDRSLFLQKSIQSGKTPDGVYQNLRRDGYSSSFTSVTPLLIGESFDSGIQEVGEYNHIATSIRSDQDGQLEIIGYDENDNEVRSVTFPYSATSGLEFFATALPCPKWQYIFTNTSGIDQSQFFITTKLSQTAFGGQVLKIDDIVPDGIFTPVTRTKLFAPDDGGVFGDIGRNKEGDNFLNVTLDNSDIDVIIQQPDDLRTGQFNVLSTVESAIPLPSGTPNVLEVRNLDTNDTNVYIGKTGLTELTGHAIPAGESFKMTYDGTNVPYLIAEDDGASVDVTDLDCDNTASNSGVTSPGNMFASDDSRAIFDTQGDNCEIDGIDGSGILGTITSVKLKIEGRKEPSAGTETMAVVATDTQSGGSTNNVVSGTLTGVAGSAMLVCISVRDVGSDVTNIVSTMGHSGFTELGKIGNGNESETSVYLLTGPTTGNGTITTSFDSFNDHYAITYVQVSNLNTSNPLVDSDTDSRTTTGAISGSVTTLSNGLVLQVVGSEICEVNGYQAGFTEQENHGSSTNNDQRQAVATIAGSGGAQAWSTSFNTDGDASAVVLSLRPADAIDPEADISYEVSNVAGATSDTLTFSSESDTTFELDITSDRAWTNSDLSNMSLLINASTISAANLEIDRYWVEVTETLGAVRISYLWTSKL